MVSFMLVRVEIFFINLSGLRNPIDCRSVSRVIDTALGTAAPTLLDDEGVRMDVDG